MASPLGCAPEPRKFSGAMEIFRVSAKLFNALNHGGEPLPDPTLHDLRHTFASVIPNGPQSRARSHAGDDHCHVEYRGPDRHPLDNSLTERVVGSKQQSQALISGRVSVH